MGENTSCLCRGRRASRLLSGGALLCTEKLALNLRASRLGEGPGLRGVGFVVIVKTYGGPNL